MESQRETGESLSLQCLSVSVRGLSSIEMFVLVFLFTGPLCVVGNVFLLEVDSVCSAFASTVCGGSEKKCDDGFLI